jgi:hypothetical protein
MFPDRVWLQEIFPHIQRRVGYTRQMLIAKEPLRMWVENRTTCAYNSPASSLVCLPAQNGCIHGRMDWHSPDFYINCWALAGFRQAAWVAGQLGESNLAAAWLAEAEMLERNVAVHLLPNYGNDRDPAVVPYPTEALIQTASLDILKREFTAWFQANRLDEAGQRRPEKLWTYFEAAQIHNAIRLGYKDLAWAALDGMLADAVHPWNVAAWVEGMPGGNEYLPFGNNAGACGWLSSQDALGGNMPHNWTSAEIIALLRTIFVHEDGDILLLGAGVPPGWFAPGSRFGVCNMPTRFGMVSYTVNVDADGKPGLDYEGAKNFRTGW